MRTALLLTLLLAAPAAAADPPVRAFFGPRPADDPRGLYLNLMRFLDSAQTSLYGAVHEVDMEAVARKLAAKAKSGVEVHLAVEADWWTQAKNTAARRALEKSPVKVTLDARKSGLMHDKFFVADKARVWTGSTNLTETCLLYNPNNAVWVESTEVAANFLAEFDLMRDGRFGKRAKAKSAKPFPAVTVGGVRVRTYFSPQDEPLGPVVAAVDAAKASVDVMAFVFSSAEVSDALLRAHRRGVQVRVLLDNLFSHEGMTRRWPAVPFRDLKAAGVLCKYDDEDSKLHHKVMVIDGATVVTGSLNFSVAAATDNDENLLVIDSKAVAAEYAAEFERLWKFYHGDPGDAPKPEAGEVDR